MTEVFLITGAGGGIGLAVTGILLNQGHQVFASYRDREKASELLSLKREYPEKLHLINLDVNSDASVAASVREVSQTTERIDVLINMAAILPLPRVTHLADLDFEQCRAAFETNALGPLRINRAFLPLLRQAENPRVINISSGAGSIGGKRHSCFQTVGQQVYRGFKQFVKKLLAFALKVEPTTGLNNGQAYAYGTSKAALNMLTCQFALEFREAGIICVALDPGWVKTTMGGANAPLTPNASAIAMLKTIKHLKIKHTASFLDRNGTKLNW